MLLTLIIGLLSVFFLFASSIKLFGWHRKVFEIQLEMFKSYGLNRQIMFLAGCAELFGADAIRPDVTRSEPDLGQSKNTRRSFWFFSPSS